MTSGGLGLLAVEVKSAGVEGGWLGAKHAVAARCRAAALAFPPHHTQPPPNHPRLHDFFVGQGWVVPGAAGKADQRQQQQRWEGE